MLTLKCDNRQLIKNTKFSYLSTNYASAVSAVVVVNSASFTASDYVLIGEFGNETSEIVLVSTITSATHTLNLATTTKFSHPQDTKVQVVNYNQVRFYHTTTTTFSVTDPVTGYIDVQPTSYYTIGTDSTNSTGFGYFVFYNSTSLVASTESNPIPYANFEEGSVKKIFDAFFSLLNNKEMKLINSDDAFRWLNEGYSITRNELNMVNPEFGVPAEWSFTTVVGTAETALPSAFGDMISLTDGEGNAIPYITLNKVKSYNETGTSDEPCYYLRGSYIGITPVPTTTDTYYAYYRSKATVLTSYYDNIDLPDNNFYFLVDHMMFRASIKLGKQGATLYEELFKEGIKNMKLVSFKQNNNNDSWGLDDYSNI